MRMSRILQEATLLLIISLELWFAGAAAQGRQPSVRTSLGRIYGTYCSGTNAPVVKFLGIPFAKPPIGRLRFRAPQRYSDPYPSEGLNATSKKSACIQGQVEDISEDCLYLNVWMPANASRSTKFGVRVWIHGGNFVSGSGNDMIYDGCQVAGDNQLIAVTISYRLGALGFLALPELKDSSMYDTTGNWGLLDQRKALVWIQENIAAFGGNPRRVMIYGQSSGGSSVYYHTLMPHSQGLFWGAIMQSPDADFASMFLKDAYAAGSFIAANMGCDEKGVRQLGYSSVKACLRAVNVSAILQAQTLFNSYFGIDLQPAVDGTRAAFPEHPYRLMTKGLMTRVPVVVGATSNEGALFVLGYLLARGLSPEEMTMDHFIDFIRPFGRVPNSFMARLVEQYDPTPYGGSWFLAAVVAAGDTNYYCPMRRVALAYSKHVRTYSYFLQQVKPNSGCAAKAMFGVDVSEQDLEFMAAWHGYDLQYVFSVPFASSDVNGGCNFTRSETQMAAFISGAWSNFAEKGYPLPPRTKRVKASQLRLLKEWARWKPGSAKTLNLDFDNPVSFDYDSLVRPRCKIWDEMLAAALKAGTNFPDLY